MVNLQSRIDDIIGTTAEPDTLRWKHNIDGQFSVKGVYRMEEGYSIEANQKSGESYGKSSSNQGKMLYLVGG